MTKLAAATGRGQRPPPEINLAEYRIRRNKVLGGLTNEYQTAA